MTHEEMVQELWDREHIKELTYQYGLAIEAQDEEKMANLFTADGSVDFSAMGRGVIQGLHTPNTPCLLYTSPSPRDS